MTMITKILTILSLLVFLGACSDGGGKKNNSTPSPVKQEQTAPTGSSNWDEMEWDDDEWA